MSKNYYYSDIEEISQQLYDLCMETEAIADRLIETGSKLSGFDGDTGDAVRERFSKQYAAIHKQQVSCREQTVKAIEELNDRFTAIDSSPNAVICSEQLDHNTWR